MNMDWCLTIIVGILSSLMATFIWFSLSQLYSVKDKGTIDSKLETVKTSLYEIGEKAEYGDDLDRVLSQIDRMFDALHECISSMKKLTYWWHFNRKKFIITAIYDLIRVCEISKNTTIGFSGESEKRARCMEIARMLGVTEITKSPKYILVQIIQGMNNNNDLLGSARNSMLGPNISAKELNDFLLDNGTIEINSFNIGGTPIRIKQMGMTREEFEKYLKRKLF